MIASTENGSAPVATRKSSRLNAAQKQRVERLSRIELAFIPNNAFKPLEADYGLDGSELLERIENPEPGSEATLAPGLPAHLARMCATPLLSPAEEKALFCRMNFCKFRVNALRSRLAKSPKLADEIELFIRKAERIRNYLVEANTRLVLSIARKFADARNSFDDLLSQGIASLMHAVEKFDFDRGYRFSTYATCAVRRDLYRMVMGRKKELQRFATGTSEHLESRADDRPVEAPNAEAEWKQISTAVAEMLNELDDRERLIVSRRFGLDGGKKKLSYNTLGRELGISKERVRQLANRALAKLRISADDRRLEAVLA